MSTKSTNLTPLPIDDFLPDILSSCLSHQNVVITASPGAGKTTRLPAALMGQCSGKILVLEPRKMAAVAAASRVCEENNWTLGDKVGYQVRFANKTSQQTQLIFMTEALLAKKIAEDPNLDGIDTIILDEFHERSMHVDLALGLIREMQELGHPIKLIVMSATLDAEKISAFLGNAPIFSVPGKIFPLEISYSKTPQLLQTNFDFYDRLAETVKEALKKTENNILVFLPGVSEIQRAADKLSTAVPSAIQIQFLHGSLSLEEQKKVLKRTSGQSLILCTNIAESSVTIDGVDCVIDSGLAKVMRHDYKTGFSRLELSRISTGSATQRAGRAARQKPGFCFRMWHKMDEHSMSPFEMPELLRTDLTDSLLFLASQDIRDFVKFTWFEAPPSLHIKKSQIYLQSIDALDTENRITKMGKELLKWPLSVRLSKLLWEAENRQQFLLGVKIVVLLQEKDFLIREQHLNIHEETESDLVYRLHILEEFLEGKRLHGVSTLALQTIKQAFEQLMQAQARREVVHQKHSWTTEDVHLLLLSAFKDRLCRRRGKGERALMSSGRGISLAPYSLAKSQEFFLALDGVETGNSADTMISIAHSIPKNFLLNQFSSTIQNQKELMFDDSKNQYFHKEVKSLWGLPLEDGSLKPLDDSQLKLLIPQILKQRKDWFAENNKSLNEFQTKLVFLKTHADYVSDEIMNEVVSIISNQNQQTTFDSSWFEDFIDLVSVGETKINDLIDKNFDWAIDQKISENLNELITRGLPSKLQVPSGSWILVHYPPDKNPYLEVRIQEIFGWEAVPKVLNSIPITIHLLGPNYRPVQLTSDLKSFWLNGYPEVRKELRIKYPKHQWPEDPKLGIAEAKGRPRK